MSSDPEPITLRYPKRYAPRQTELIQSILDKSSQNFHYFKDPKNGSWTHFWDSAWGKDPDSLDGTEGFERGCDPINDALILPDAVPPRREIMFTPEVLRSCWCFESKKFLIRSEYKEAEKFILSTYGTEGMDGMVVIGQPGIGKSAFLLRILLFRLACELPTALQIHPDYALLFYEGGVKEFVWPDEEATYSGLKSQGDPLGRIWALVDSNSELQAPAPALRSRTFFVIGISSPHPTYGEWIMKLSLRSFYMKPWSFAEVLQARSLINQDFPSEKQLWHLHDTYGASLRCLFMLGHLPDYYDLQVDTEISQLSPSGLTNLFARPLNAVKRDTCHLVSIGPSQTSRTQPQTRPISEYVLEKICKRVLEDQVAEIKKLYNWLRLNPFASIAVGMLFKYWAHRLLQEGKVIKLFPILGRTYYEGKTVIYDNYTATDQKQLTLPKLKEHIFTGEIDALEVDTYYRPRSTSFPTIDSWLLVQPTARNPPILLVFQMTLDMERREVHQSDLDKIDKLVTPQGTKRYLVVTTPAEVRPKIAVSGDYMTDEFLAHRDPNVVFPVYHCQIG